MGIRGTGQVARQHAEAIQANPHVYIAAVCGRDPEHARAFARSAAPQARIYNAYADMLADPDVDVIVECMPNYLHAEESLLALQAKKHVVTANKALIAAYYTDLTALARENGVALRCTAAVGGGIPWLTNLERCKRLDTVTEVGGIMNGTTNFIMDAMHTSPVSFPAILKKAQELGYAEADPSADIDGDDIRRKLTISANIAFDAVLDEERIPTFGIRTVTDGDIAAFQRHGFVCKMLAAAQKCGDRVCAMIEPTLVNAHDPEASVPTNYNLISYTAEKVGRQSFFGQGAGRFPTASNVVQDCLDILAGHTSFYTEAMKPTELEDAVAHPYYVRTACPDKWLEGITVDHWDGGPRHSSGRIPPALLQAFADTIALPGPMSGRALFFNKFLCFVHIIADRMCYAIGIIEGRKALWTSAALRQNRKKSLPASLLPFSCCCSPR